MELSTEASLILVHILPLFGLVVQGKEGDEFLLRHLTFSIVSLATQYKKQAKLSLSRATFLFSSAGGGPGLTVGFPKECHTMATTSQWRPVSCCCLMWTQASWTRCTLKVCGVWTSLSLMGKGKEGGRFWRRFNIWLTIYFETKLSPAFKMKHKKWSEKFKVRGHSFQFF